MMQTPDTFFGGGVLGFFFKTALRPGRDFVCLGAIEVFNVCN